MYKTRLNLNLHPNPPAIVNCELTYISATHLNYDAWDMLELEYIKVVQGLVLIPSLLFYLFLNSDPEQLSLSHVVISHVNDSSPFFPGTYLFLSEDQTLSSLSLSLSLDTLLGSTMNQKDNYNINLTSTQIKLLSAYLRSQS